MILYEVNLRVQPEILPEFRSWLTEHVREMLGFAGFETVEIFESEDSGELVCCYRIKDRRSLKDYLDQHAPRMRQAGLARFGEKFAATRRRILKSSEKQGFPVSA